MSKVDLKALSLVSKRCHSGVAEALWDSVVIEPVSEHDLHRIDAAALPQSRRGVSNLSASCTSALISDSS